MTRPAGRPRPLPLGGKAPGSRSRVITLSAERTNSDSGLGFSRSDNLFRWCPGDAYQLVIDNLEVVVWTRLGHLGMGWIDGWMKVELEKLGVNVNVVGGYGCTGT
jgi:hypothetical protein